jgi:Ca-activated chloride channel homolog
MIAAAEPTEVLARIRIHGPAQKNATRPRANIGLVVDTSGSMAGDPIAQARAAALTLLGDLRDGDVLSVVVFGSVPEVLVPATILDPQVRPRIRAEIERMQATGTTDLAGGLGLGLQQVQSHARHGEVNRIVLVSDGVPNDETSIASLAQHARGAGIPITALGLGLDYHETLLGQIAQASGGKFHFVEDPAKVAAVFREEVLRIDSLAARGVSLTLTPGPGVGVLEVLGHSPGYSGRSVVVGLPDLAEGETQQVIVRLSVGQHSDGASVELLDGVVSYADARTGLGRQERTFIAAKATADPVALEQGVSLEVAVAAARATTAATTLNIVQLARGGDVWGATTLLDQTVQSAKELQAALPDAELARLVDDLVALRPTLEGLAPQPVAVDRPRGKGKAHPDELEQSQPPPRKGDGTGRDAVAPEPMSPASARGVRTSHEHAYKVLHGG